MRDGYKHCTLDNQVCNTIDEELFKMIVTDDIEFSGSEDGTKLNLNGDRFTVTEEVNLGREDPDNYFLMPRSRI